MPVAIPIFTAIGTAVGASGTTATVVGGAIAAGTVGAAGYGISQMAKGGGKQKQITGPSGSAKADLAAAEKAAAERAALANDKRKAALARSRTIYTSPLGISEKAQVAKKTLTGQ